MEIMFKRHYKTTKKNCGKNVIIMLGKNDANTMKKIMKFNKTED